MISGDRVWTPWLWECCQKGEGKREVVLPYDLWHSLYVYARLNNCSINDALCLAVAYAVEMGY